MTADWNQGPITPESAMLTKCSRMGQRITQRAHDSAAAAQRKWSRGYQGLHALAFWRFGLPLEVGTTPLVFEPSPPVTPIIIVMSTSME